MGARFEEGTTNVAAHGNSWLGRDGETGPPPGRRGEQRHDGRDDSTNARGDQRSTERYPRYDPVRFNPTGTLQTTPANKPTVEEADSMWAPLQFALAKQQIVERTTEARSTTAIEGGSFVLAHNSAKAKSVSIGGCKRNYNPPATSHSVASSDRYVIRSVIGLAPLGCARTGP
jgi:hypothetical protein